VADESPSTRDVDDFFSCLTSARGSGGNNGRDELSASNADTALAMADCNILSDLLRKSSVSPEFDSVVLMSSEDRRRENSTMDGSCCLCRLLNTMNVSIRFSIMLPSNPECNAANHSSLSNVVGAEQRTWVLQ
jgi:hypothetical protein